MAEGPFPSAQRRCLRIYTLLSILMPPSLPPSPPSFSFIFLCSHFSTSFELERLLLLVSLVLLTVEGCSQDILAMGPLSSVRGAPSDVLPRDDLIPGALLVKERLQLDRDLAGHLIKPILLYLDNLPFICLTVLSRYASSRLHHQTLVPTRTSTGPSTKTGRILASNPGRHRTDTCFF